MKSCKLIQGGPIKFCPVEFLKGNNMISKQFNSNILIGVHSIGGDESDRITGSNPDEVKMSEKTFENLRCQSNGFGILKIGTIKESKPLKEISTNKVKELSYINGAFYFYMFSDLQVGIGLGLQLSGLSDIKAAEIFTNHKHLPSASCKM